MTRDDEMLKPNRDWSDVLCGSFRGTNYLLQNVNIQWTHSVDVIDGIIRFHSHCQLIFIRPTIDVHVTHNLDDSRMKTFIRQLLPSLPVSNHHHKSPHSLVRPINSRVYHPSNKVRYNYLDVPTFVRKSCVLIALNTPKTPVPFNRNWEGRKQIISKSAPSKIAENRRSSVSSEMNQQCFST